MDPILKYLQEGELPKDREVARNVKNRLLRYLIVDRVLYKWDLGFST